MRSASAQPSFAGNAKAAALPSIASGRLAVDYGEFVIDPSNGRLGEPAAAEGDLVVPGGGPGRTLEIRVTACMGSYGAFSGRMLIPFARAKEARRRSYRPPPPARRRDPRLQVRRRPPGRSRGTAASTRGWSTRSACRPTRWPTPSGEF